MFKPIGAHEDGRKRPAVAGAVGGVTGTQVFGTSLPEPLWARNDVVKLEQTLASYSAATQSR